MDSPMKSKHENPNRVLPGEATSQIRGVQIESGKVTSPETDGFTRPGKPIF